MARENHTLLDKHQLLYIAAEKKNDIPKMKVDPKRFGRKLMIANLGSAADLTEGATYLVRFWSLR